MLWVSVPLHRFNYAPDLQVPEKTYENPEASGRNRYRYFRRPIIPFLPRMPPSVLLAPTRSETMPLLMCLELRAVGGQYTIRVTHAQHTTVCLETEFAVGPSVSLVDTCHTR